MSIDVRRDIDDEVDEVDEVTPQGPPAAGGARFDRVHVLLAGLVLLSLVVLTTGSIAWSRAEVDASIEYAASRDRVLVEATQAVEVLNTLDHDDLDAGLAAWVEVSTGTLRDQLSSLRPEDREALGATGSVSTATVLDAGLTELDLRAGSATGIFVVEITVDAGTGPAEAKRSRYVGDLVRGDDDRWRFASLLPVEVTA